MQPSVKGIVSAAKARAIAGTIRKMLPNVIRKRVEEELARAIELGHSVADVDLSDLGLEGGVSDEELAEMTKDLDDELIAAGYKVEWDGGNSVTLFF